MFSGQPDPNCANTQEGLEWRKVDEEVKNLIRVR
jgi:hypothetical protein